MAYISKRDAPGNTAAHVKENDTHVINAARPGSREDSEKGDGLEDDADDEDDENFEDDEDFDEENREEADKIFRQNLETEFPLSGGETDEDA